LSIFHTVAKGIGLKASENIKKYTFVCEYAGEVLTMTEAKRRTTIIETTNAMNYILVLREFVPNYGTVETCVDPSSVGNVGRFINHSCVPNLVMLPVRVDNNVPKLCLFSARDISSGEELTFDYSGEFRLGLNTRTGPSTLRADLGDVAERRECTSLERKPCLCGTSSCKGFLPYDSSLYEK
jgi:histone-lysine N-methyltransferase SETMAR